MSQTLIIYSTELMTPLKNSIEYILQTLSLSSELKYKTVKWKRRMPKNIMIDAEVKLSGYLSEKKYPELFRLVRYYDEEDDREFTFLTNTKQLSALDVANLYKKRWLIELFFK